MKNLSLIRRFTLGSMILGLVVPMIYHVALNLSRYNHFNSLTKQVCKAIEPNIQIGGRQALEYLVSSVTNQGIGASPEVEFKDHGILISPPILAAGSKFHESCAFEGISGVEVNIYYNRATLLNMTYLYLYLVSVPTLFLVFMLARLGVMRVQRKVADLIEGQMKQLFGLGLDSEPPLQKTSLFYKLFDLEIPLLKYLKKHIETLETDLKGYSQKIVDQQKREVLMDVAAQMAHEIVTPISNLQTILQSDEFKENQELLLMELTQIKSLSEKLLREYRGEPSSQKQEPEKIDVVESLKAIIEGTKIFAKKLRPVSFHFEYIPQDKFELLGDRSQFIAAISNILRNSVEALDKDNSEIKIHLAKDSKFLTLSISDNGCGIKEKDLAKVFENKVSIGKKNGSGLGLYQVKSAIENMNGEIELISKLDVGTTMKLIWPVGNNSYIQSEDRQFESISISKAFENPDLILIDDKRANHVAWDIQARRCQKKLMTFLSPEEFHSNSHNFGKETPIFVDYLFENDSSSGNEIAAKIILEGFKNVHIATGLPVDRVARPIGIRSVVGKEFPPLDLL